MLANFVHKKLFILSSKKLNKFKTLKTYKNLIKTRKQSCLLYTLIENFFQMIIHNYFSKNKITKNINKKHML